MTSVHQEQVHASMQLLCDSVLELDKVRFAGVISNLGNLYAGGFKKGITPYANNEKRRSMYMRFALESSFRKDFDDSFGEFQYSIIQRKNVSIITLSICSYILLVFAEPHIDVHTLINWIQNLVDINEE